MAENKLQADQLINGRLSHAGKQSLRGRPNWNGMFLAFRYLKQTEDAIIMGRLKKQDGWMNKKETMAARFEAGRGPNARVMEGNHGISPSSERPYLKAATFWWCSNLTIACKAPGN